MSNITSERWHSSKLGSLFKILKGSIDPQQNPREKLEYYSIPGFDKNGSSSYVYGADIESNKTLITEPSILVSKLNPRKPRVQIVTKAEKYRQCASTEFMAYAPRHPGTDLKFFKYYFVSEYFSNRLQLVATGSTNSHVRVTPSETLRWKVPVPPLPEQQKIAAILSSVDDVIEKTRAQIDKLKDLKTGMMQELLTKGIGHTEFKDSPVGRIPEGWAVKSTGQLCDSIVPGRNKPTSLDGDIPWLTINDLGDLYVNRSKMGYGVTKAVLADAKGKTLPPRAVIMSCVGEFGIASVASREVVINQQLHGFVCGTNVHPEYLCYVLSTKSNEMLNLATQTTIAYMNKTNCESVLIPVPPIAEQRKISGVLKSFDLRIRSLNKTLFTFTDLKKALMQDLLTGKVRVKLNNSDSTTAAAQSADSTEEQQYDHA